MYHPGGRALRARNREFLQILSSDQGQLYQRPENPFHLQYYSCLEILL